MLLKSTMSILETEITVTDSPQKYLQAVTPKPKKQSPEHMDVVAHRALSLCLQPVVPLLARGLKSVLSLVPTGSIKESSSTPTILASPFALINS